MKNILKITILMTVFSLTVRAQTNVSGGIYSNTTWTLANSPYIVTDTVVVFPGVTLTIEPGVTVKFEDGVYLEIRQGTLIADGTAADSITITSNSLSPVIGIYQGIRFTDPVALSIDYCIFQYAYNALILTNTNFNSDTITMQHSYFYMNNNCFSSSYNPVVINRSSFYNNNNCIPGTNYPLYLTYSEFYNNINCIGTLFGNVWACFLDSCIFMNNQFGVDVFDHGHAVNCIFGNNKNAFSIEDETKYAVSNSVFCNNEVAILMHAHQSHDTIINCDFSQNHIAVQCYSSLDYFADNILFENDTALLIDFAPTDSVFNNYIFHNQAGLFYGGGASASFFNNYICNNSLYNIIYTSTLNDTIPPQCYCNTDSTIIRSKIYDGYVDITRGLLSFTPFIICDSSALSSISISCPNITSGINSPNQPDNSFFLYPNPATSEFTVKDISSEKHVLLQIINLLGENVYTKNISGKSQCLVNIHLTQGIYFVQVSDGVKKLVRKLIVE